MRRVVIVIALSAACVDQDAAAVRDCCACIATKQQNGDDATSADDNCLADPDVGGDLAAETKNCSDAFAVPVLAGADFARVVELGADGCRSTCADACAALDDDVAFETPVVSAGTFTATAGGSAVEATFVVATIGDALDVGGRLVTITAVVDEGAWHATLAGIDGPGSYPFARATSFLLDSPADGPGEGTFDVSAFDDEHLEATFAGTLQGAQAADDADDVPLADGAMSVSFVVNDGEESGLVGLR